MAGTLRGKIAGALAVGLVGVLIGALSPVGDVMKCFVGYGMNRLLIAARGYSYDPQGLTKAINDNRSDIVLLFVAPCGFDKDQTYTPPPNQYRPLWYAAQTAKPNVVLALLDAGANCFFVPAGGNNVTFPEAVEYLARQEHKYEAVLQVVRAHRRCYLKADG
jgi:hypothetical protein